MSNPSLSMKTRLILIAFISIILVGCNDNVSGHIEDSKYEINYATETGSGKKVKKQKRKNYENTTQGEMKQ